MKNGIKLLLYLKATISLPYKQLYILQITGSFMNRIFTRVLAVVAMMLVVQACGPSEQELQQQEQARLDSLERVRVMQLEQARADSLAMVRLENEQDEAEEEEAADVMEVVFEPNGAFAVQVGSWRSETMADSQAELWKERGYSNAYTVQYGDEETGDVWFRVRLGRVADREMAELLQREVMDEHGAESWISLLR